MGMLNFETIEPPQPLLALPVRLEQSSPRTMTALSLMFIALAGLAIITPFVAVTLHLIEAPEARSLMSEQPGSVLQLGFGLAIWTALLGWPAKRLAKRLSARRIVTLTARDVTVDERGLFGSRTWSAPITSYTGVAHHVRASLSGVRHELILLHDDPSRSVLLAIAPRFSQAELDRVCDLLGAQEISARLLYERPVATATAAFPAFSSQTA